MVWRPHRDAASHYYQYSCCFFIIIIILCLYYCVSRENKGGRDATKGPSWTRKRGSDVSWSASWPLSHYSAWIVMFLNLPLPPPSGQHKKHLTGGLPRSLESAVHFMNPFYFHKTFFGFGHSVTFRQLHPEGRMSFIFHYARYLI